MNGASYIATVMFHNFNMVHFGDRHDLLLQKFILVPLWGAGPNVP